MTTVPVAQEGVPYDVMMEIEEMKAELAAVKHTIALTSPIPSIIFSPCGEFTPKRRKRMAEQVFNRYWLTLHCCCMYKHVVAAIILSSKTLLPHVHQSYIG